MRTTLLWVMAACGLTVAALHAAQAGGAKAEPPPEAAAPAEARPQPGAPVEAEARPQPSAQVEAEARPQAGAASEPPRQPSAAATDCAVATADQVQAFYDDVGDLRANFTQRSQSVALGGSGGESTGQGTMVFAKPGRMHWEYTAPEPSVVVSDGETLWIYDPEAREVQVLSVGSGILSSAGLAFLLGDGDLLETFEVEAEGCGQTPVRLRLLPREDAPYEQIGLHVAPDSGMVVATQVTDLFGNRTELDFSNLETNLGPSDDLFRFEPPSGTRILRMDPDGP